MTCPSCASGRQAEFVAEVNLHFRGLKNPDKPGILVFPKVLVCMDCGSAQFSTPENDLALLASGASPSDTPMSKGMSQSGAVVGADCDSAAVWSVE